MISRPNTPVLLGRTVKPANTLLKIHAVGFRELSGVLLRFPRAEACFWAQPICYFRRVLFAGTGAKKHGFWRFLVKNHDVPGIGKMDKSVKIRHWRNEQLPQNKLRRTPRIILRSLPAFLSVPPSKSRIFRPKTSARSKSS